MRGYVQSGPIYFEFWKVSSVKNTAVVVAVPGCIEQNFFTTMYLKLCLLAMC
jgi:hypothetical protein